MADLTSKPEGTGHEPDAAATGPVPVDPALNDLRPIRIRRIRVVPLLLTSLAVVAAAVMSWEIWQTYMASPWTRDGRVRAYVITVAPEVAGRIQSLPVADNQYVHKGDLLMVVDPTNFAIAVSTAQAQVEQAEADMQNKQLEARRRENLNSLSTSVEEKESYAAQALAATGVYHQAVSSLARAQTDLKRTRIVSPVDGWVTNLLLQAGDYVDVGERFVSIVNADSFWVDAYFQETNLHGIQPGDPAEIQLMGSNQVLHGHVQGIAHGITVSNAQAGPGGLAIVNPVFTWVRLAERVPIRIAIDHIPADVHLLAGQTATVQVDVSRKQNGQ